VFSYIIPLLCSALSESVKNLGEKGKYGSDSLIDYTKGTLAQNLREEAKHLREGEVMASVLVH